MRRVESLYWLIAVGLGLLAIWQALLLGDTQSPLTPKVGLDFVPVYAGSRAVAAGLNPNNPHTIARILQEVGLGHYSSHNAYPASWGFLLMPWTGMDFAKLFSIWRDFLLLALVVSAPFAAWAAPMRRRSWGWIATALILWVWSQLWVTRLSLDLGQTNLVLVLSVSAVLFMVARGWDRAAGVVLALGAAAKLLPGVLLLIALLRRRWWLLGSAVAVGGLVLVGTWAKVPQWSVFGYLDLTKNLVAHSRFGTLDGVPSEPIVGLSAWVFSQRGALLLLGTLLPLLAVWRRESDRELDVACLGFLLSCFAANGAMSYTNYEAVLLLPVIGWVVSWPASRDPIRWSLPLCALTIAVLLASGLHHPVSDKDPLAWAPAAMMLWIACAARFALHLRRVPVRVA